jgi:hypothetical protein
MELVELRELEMHAILASPGEMAAPVKAERIR